jgi:methionyl-tRNA formyltransferase
MNIVFLTNGSTHGQSILRALDSRKLRPQTIIIERQEKRRMDEIRRSIRKYGLWATALDVAAFVKRKLAGGGVPFRYEEYASSVVTVTDHNAADTVQLIERHRADLLILGGCRILREPVLSTARIAVLNAHPGKLPEYKGVDVVAWAIYNGHQPFVTVHCVNAGVDTGDIVSQGEVSLDASDSLATLRNKCEHLAGELMADAVRVIAEKGQVVSTPQPPSASKQYYRMPRKLLRKAENMLRSRWKSPP